MVTVDTKDTLASLVVLESWDRLGASLRRGVAAQVPKGGTHMQRPDKETVGTVIPNPHRGQPVLATSRSWLWGTPLPLHFLSSFCWKIFFIFSIGP